MDSSVPRCDHCGSDRLRRSHSRSGLQKLLRRNTGWDRYACQACGQRGWSWGKVPRRARSDGAATASPGSTLAGRRLERRDVRLQRKVRVKSFVTVAASLVLGVLAAVYLQRCGAGVPPVE